LVESHSPLKSGDKSPHSKEGLFSHGLLSLHTISAAGDTDMTAMPR
jgi:hypothetical protein